MRRKDLTPSVSVERDKRGIVNGLQNDAATDLNTMSTVLKIVIRIRNNLFHGNKDAYLLLILKSKRNY